MNLIDIMEDISTSRVVKTDTGDNRIFGVMVGIIDQNYDMNQPGKVCVRIPNRDNNMNVLKWAKVATSYMGKNWGTYIVPEVGDEVLVTFEEGNIDKPYVIASIPKSDAKLVSSSSDRTNAIKEIRARSGKAFLRYKDDGQDSDQQDHLTLQLFNGQLFLEMDSQTETVIIADKNKENMIMMDGQDNNGLLRIKLQKKIEVKVGDSITVTLDGQEGKMNIKCDTLNVTTNKKTSISASGGLDLKSDGDFNAQGNKCTIKSSSAINLEASGTASLNGSAIKIG